MLVLKLYGIKKMPNFAFRKYFFSHYNFFLEEGHNANVSILTILYNTLMYLEDMSLGSLLLQSTGMLLQLLWIKTILKKISLHKYY